MGFSRQECWNGLPCPPPRYLPDPGIEPVSLTFPALAGGFFTTNTKWEVHGSNDYDIMANIIIIISYKPFSWNYLKCFLCELWSSRYVIHMYILEWIKYTCIQCSRTSWTHYLGFKPLLWWLAGENFFLTFYKSSLNLPLQIYISISPKK